jgi:hypothetical protein
MSSPIDHGNNNLKAGDYRLEKLVLHSLTNGTSVPLNNLFRRIEIYEDIFSPYVTAKVFVEDAFNFPERVPIVGQEKVEISFKSDINSFDPLELLFRVYKLDTHSIEQNGKAQRYTLHLISEGGFFNFSQYCGYSLTGSVSDMVGSVMKKHFPENIWTDRLEVQKTIDKYSFVVPGSYTPFKAIEWLCGKAFSSEGAEYSPYLWYETLDGYRFKSLANIIQDGSLSVPYYVYTQPNVNPLEGIVETARVETDVPNRYLKVQKLDELSRFDAVSNIMNGMISSKLAVHDLVRKQMRVSEFREAEVFEAVPKLGEFPHFRTSDPQTHRLLASGASYYYLPSTPFTVTDISNGIIDNHKHESLYLKRKYHMNSFLTQKIAITVFGDSRRRLGDIVHLDVLKPQSDGSAVDDRYDKNLSGQYMITTIKHTLSTAYSCSYELSRNCMGV